MADAGENHIEDTIVSRNVRPVLGLKIEDDGSI